MQMGIFGRILHAPWKDTTGPYLRQHSRIISRGILQKTMRTEMRFQVGYLSPQNIHDGFRHSLIIIIEVQ